MSSTKGKGASERGSFNTKAFKKRTISSLFLVMIPILFFYYGSEEKLFFSPFVFHLLLTALLTYEWSKVCKISSYLLRFFTPFCIAISLFCLKHGRYEIAVLLTIISALIFYGIGVLQDKRLYRWTGIGFVYLGFPILSSYWMVRFLPHGSLLLVWLVLVIIANDVGAYLFGNFLKGPKLAPKISPGKTWSGFLGGIVTAVVVGGVFSYLNQDILHVLLYESALFAVVGSCGDLLESLIKRHFKVKDSGKLIPGHGGVLDRLDGFLLAVPILLIFSISISNFLIIAL